LPAIPRPARGDDDKSVKDQGSELVSMVIAYAKQETLDPLKSLGRYLIWGVLGAILLSIGGLLLTLAVLRLLQTELHHHLSGSLTWVPYVGALLFAAIIVGAAISRIGKVSR
jgi:FtsH-binding integral membrane protein